jgi:hypothetical protein
MILGMTVVSTSLTSLFCESTNALRAFGWNDELLKGESIVAFGASGVLVKNAELLLAAATSMNGNKAFLEYDRIF